VGKNKISLFTIFMINIYGGKWMRIRELLFTVSILALFLLSTFIADAGFIEESKVESAREVLSEIMKIPEKRVPPVLFKDTYGIAVIPGAIKLGFVVGGRYGQGILTVRTPGGEWSNPLFITLTGASVGFQAGVQSTDVILVFKSKKSVDGIIKGTVTLGADASVAAGPVGRQAEAATDIELKAEIYSYSQSRGIFAGVALDGAILAVDNQATSAFYNVSNADPGEVFAGKKYTAPPVADKLNQDLTKYSNMK
jgi:lipid-binding SYLF domain-containing protein